MIINGLHTQNSHATCGWLQVMDCVTYRKGIKSTSLKWIYVTLCRYDLRIRGHERWPMELRSLSTVKIVTARNFYNTRKIYPIKDDASIKKKHSSMEVLAIIITMENTLCFDMHSHWALRCVNFKRCIEYNKGTMLGDLQWRVATVRLAQWKRRRMGGVRSTHSSPTLWINLGGNSLFERYAAATSRLAWLCIV